MTDELFTVCFGRKAVDIHHGNLCTDIVTYFVELGAVQITCLHMIILGHDFLQQLNGFLAGRSAEDIVMVAKAGDVALLLLRRGQSVGCCYKTISFGILACNDGCSCEEADNGLFFVSAAGSLVRAGLSNDFFDRETAVDYFGNAEDMMCAGVSDSIFLQAGLVIFPLENQRLGKIMECLSGNDDITADFAVEKIDVSIVDAFGNGKVCCSMGCQTAGISMVTAVTAAGSGIKRLRSLTVVRREKVCQSGFGGVNKLQGYQLVIDCGFGSCVVQILTHEGGVRIFYNIHGHLTQTGILDGGNAFFDFIVAHLNKLGALRQSYGIRQIGKGTALSFCLVGEGHMRHIKECGTGQSTGGNL